MSFVERRRHKRVTIDASAPVELEFTVGDEAIRIAVVNVSEHGLGAECPMPVRVLLPGQSLNNVVLHQSGSNAVHLRSLTVADTHEDDRGRRTLRLIASDEQAQAGLWLVVDRLTSRQLGRGVAAAAARVRVRPIPHRGVYTERARLDRLAYICGKTGVALSALEQTSLRAESLAGNIENLIGSVEVPVGLAGPLLFRGEKTHGLVYAPMATTEGTLIASATRGAIAITRAGGVATRVVRRQMMRVPLFVFSDMRGAHRFSNWVRDHFTAIREQTTRVSRYADLLKVEPELRGNMVTVTFLYETGDAAGQNMTTGCTWHACQWLMRQMTHLDEIRLVNFFIESGVSGDKKVSFQSFISGRGTRVTADCVLPASVVEEVLKVTPDELVRGFEMAAAFGVQSGTVGWNINVANVIAAMFTATGQDIACVHESSVALLYLQRADEGVYASLVLPSLVIGTVGGGTHLPRQTELLDLMGCAGATKVSRLAEIIAGFCLALDLSTLAAIAGGQFAAAHERLGRSRSVKWFTREDLVPAFFQDGLRRALADPSVVVHRVQVGEPADTGSSVLTELTANKIGKLIGLIPVNLDLGAGAGGQRRAINLMVKVKPLDDEVILMTNHLAAMCGPRLARSHARFKDRIGFKGCHVRELAVYEQTDPRFRRHTPGVFGTFRDEAREAYVVVLENLSGLELMDSANQIDSWTDEHLEAAISGIASVHAIWYGRDEELRQRPWLGRTLTTHDMIEMRGLWEDLSVHAAKEFPEWFLESDLTLRQTLVDTMPEWWARLESLPRTLIHNDFNPRNLAFRRELSGPSLVAYDWELATVGQPQHDLAELLCYVLTPETPRAEVDRWVELHRTALAQEAGQEVPAEAWREGFKLCLFDLAVNRMALTIVAHTFRSFPFVERVSSTLRHLIELETSV